GASAEVEDRPGTAELGGGDPRVWSPEIDLVGAFDLPDRDPCVGREPAAERAGHPRGEPAEDRARREAADPRLAAGGETAPPARVGVGDEVFARVAVRAVLVDLEVRLPVCGQADARNRAVAVRPEEDDHQ